MSVVLASALFTVHLFGYTTREDISVPFDSMVKCINSLDIIESKARKIHEAVVTRDADGVGYLKVSNASEHTVKHYHCMQQ